MLKMKDSAIFQNENQVSKRSERRIEWIGKIPERLKAGGKKWKMKSSPTAV